MFVDNHSIFLPSSLYYYGFDVAEFIAGQVYGDASFILITM